MRLLASKKGKSVCLDSPLQVVITIEYQKFFGFNIYRIFGLERCLYARESIKLPPTLPF